MNNFSSINDRIFYIIENQCNKNQKKFADLIGFSPQVVGNIVAGRRSKPSYDVLVAILSSFVDIDTDWLILGKGEMLKHPEGPAMVPQDQPKDRQKEIDRLLELLDEKDQKLKKKDLEIDRLKKRNTHYGLQHVAEERPDSSKLKD